MTAQITPKARTIARASRFDDPPQMAPKLLESLWFAFVPGILHGAGRWNWV
jgi:hypothetical protein